MEQVMWLVLGATVVIASLFVERSARARTVARVALGALFLVFGAVVDAVYLSTDRNSFDGFGDMSQFAFVRDTWGSLVAPNTGVFIGWWLWIYAVPMLVALGLLLRAERDAAAAHRRPTTSTGDAAGGIVGSAGTGSAGPAGVVGQR